MQDAELSALIRQFQAVQVQSVEERINERCAVEIVKTLSKEGYLSLLYSTDGKEFITWPELMREIYYEVEAHGGRLSVVDLPGLLGVDPAYVERAIPDVLQENDCLKEGGEILTKGYLSKLVCFARDLLSDQGFCSFASFASEVGLSTAFVQQILLKAVESKQLKAIVQDDALYTARFCSAQEFILRSCLMAASSPVDVVEVMKRNKIFSPLQAMLLEALRTSMHGRFNGTIFTPVCFERNRDTQVDGMYISNGHAEYITLERLGVLKARAYMLERYNPPNTTAVLQRSGGGRKKSHNRKGTAAQAEVSLEGTEGYPNFGYALRRGFLADRLLACCVGLEELARGEQGVLRLSDMLPSWFDYEVDWPVILPRLTQLVPAVGDCSLIEGDLLVHKDAKERFLHRLNEALEEDWKQNKVGPSKERLAELVLQLVADIVEGVSPDCATDLTETFQSLWAEEASEVEHEVQRRHRVSTGAQLKQLRQRLQTELQKEWSIIFLTDKGLQGGAKLFDSNTVAALHRHALQKIGVPFIRQLLLNESLDNEALYLKVSDVLESLSTSVESLGVALKAFAAQRAEELRPVVQSAEGKSFTVFTEAIHSLCGKGQLAVSGLYPLGKSVERSLMTSLREEVEQRVSQLAFSTDGTSSAGLFATLCTLLVHRLFRLHLDLPGKVIPGVVSRLTEEVGCPEELHTALDTIMQGVSSGSISEDHVSTLEQLRQQVLETKTS